MSMIARALTGVLLVSILTGIYEIGFHIGAFEHAPDPDTFGAILLVVVILYLLPDGRTNR